MKESVERLGEEIKDELEAQFRKGSFRKICEAIMSRAEEFRKERIAVNLPFDALVTSSSTPRPKPVFRFPLAFISTGQTFPSNVKEDPEEEKVLPKWAQGWSAVRYSVGFGKYPSFAKKGIEICPHCNGQGFKIT